MNIYCFQYYTTTGIPDRQLEPNICAVCGNIILVQDNNNAIVEKTYNLSCGHTYPFFVFVALALVNDRNIVKPHWNAFCKVYKTFVYLNMIHLTNLGIPEKKLMLRMKFIGKIKVSKLASYLEKEVHKLGYFKLCKP